MSDEDYNVTRRSVENLLSDGKEYAIPSYQRRYAWTVDNAQQLFKDLTEADTMKTDSPTNLLGAMVIMTKMNLPELEVVDGQQRLATLSMLFCAIRTYLYKFNNVTLTGAGMVVNHMIKKLDCLLEVRPGRVRITLGEFDQDLFRDIITNKDSDYEKFCKELQRKYQNGKRRIADSYLLMINNYRILCKETTEWAQRHFKLDQAIAEQDADKFIENIHMLETLVSNITKHNHFAYIQVTNRHVAYKIFNTFNSLGQRLRQADLIKSHLLTVADQDQDKTTQQYIKTAWQRIFDERLEEKDDDFLYLSLSSRYPSGKVKDCPISISMANLYRIIADTVNNADEARQFVDKLETDAKLVKQMDYPDDLDTDQKYDKLKSDFHGMQLLNVGYIRVPILTAYRKWGYTRLHDLSMLVDCLLIFFFKFKFINGGTAEAVRSIANTVTTDINNDESVSSIIYHILMDESVSGEPRRRIDPDEFKKNFKEKMFKLTANAAKYILVSLEIYNRKEEHWEDPYPSYNFELEHILPKNHEKNWKDEEFLDSTSNDPISKYKQRLGNLTLLSSKWNKNLGAKDFPTKKNAADIGYAKSKFIITKKYLKDYDKWTASNLDSREEQLCALALAVWDLDKYNKYLEKNDSTT